MPPLAFLSPWLLAALVLLPLLWLLLRLVPPRPRRVDFPPTRLLLDIEAPRETPAETPWWLILIRLGLAALVILALARPVWNPAPAGTGGSGPLLLVIDNGWAAAPDWTTRVGAATQVLAAAEEAGRRVALVPSADARGGAIAFGTPSAALRGLRVLEPQPVVPDRGSLGTAIGAVLDSERDAEIVWFADGLSTGDAGAFAEILRRSGRALTVYAEATSRIHGLAAASNSAGALTARVLRAQGAGAGAEDLVVRAADLRGSPLGETHVRFEAGARESEARFDMPVELRNDVARLDIVGERSAAAVQLMDGRWKRRTVGLVTGTTADTALPLLAPAYYLTRALSPFSDVRRAAAAGPAGIAELLDANVPILVLADVGTLLPEIRERLAAWVRAGGVLVRFAGARLASADDELVPVRLRRGGRVLGGALAWETPQPLGSFSPTGPFAGLPVANDVAVSRQVLAEPDSTLSDRTWASLADGTPLVTGAADGKGEVVLFHVTADTTWSNLPLSGSFVDMLRKIVGMSGQPAKPAESAEAAADAPAAAAPATVSPSRTLDGFGAFRTPPATARPIPAGGASPTLSTPPGFYGPPDGLVAVNTLADDATIEAMGFAGLGATLRGLAVVEPVALMPWLLTAAAVLGIVDCVVVFLLAGGLMLLTRRLRRGAATTAILLSAALASVLPPHPAHAQSAADRAAVDATLATHLAYVVTGNAEIDETSRAGLEGLTLALGSRTALEPGAPIGVDPSRDELAFFPLLYWPVDPAASPPTAETLSRVDSYMKQGGTIVFDSRDALYGGGDGGPGAQALRRLLAQLDIPELEPVPRDHVLTKAFYLLQDFPGRYATSPLWVEAMPAAETEGEERPARPGDGVSPVLITGNDLAGAWAIGPDGSPLYPTEPSDARQREMSYRVGINIVMYTLTGNYKADQVHVPALLERLGQ